MSRGKDTHMNIQGIFSIHSYPASQVSLPPVFKHQTLDPNIYTTAVSKSFDFVKGSASMKVSPKKDAAGNLSNIVVSYTMAGNNPSLLSELDYQSILPHIYLLQDNIGQRYILGTNRGPLPELSYTLKNDGDGKGGRSIQVKITLLTHLFPVYAPKVVQEFVDQPDNPDV